jgi:hypothetical protein
MLITVNVLLKKILANGNLISLNHDLYHNSMSMRMSKKHNEETYRMSKLNTKKILEKSDKRTSKNITKKHIGSPDTIIGLNSSLRIVSVRFIECHQYRLEYFMQSINPSNIMRLQIY